MSGRRQTQGHTVNVASGGGGVCFRPILPVVKGHFEASIPFDRLSLTGRYETLFKNSSHWKGVGAWRRCRTLLFESQDGTRLAAELYQPG